MKFEFEDYKTKERTIEDTQEECNINVGRLLSRMDGGNCFGLLLDEFIFADYLLNKDENNRVYRLPMKASHPMFRYMDFVLDKEFGLDIKKVCLGAGCPDFMIANFNTKELFFLEVKKDDEGETSNGENSLHKNQLDWYQKNSNQKLIIGRLKPMVKRE